MSGPNPGKLGAIVLGLFAISILSVVLKGGLYLTNFEGDAYHLADIVLRRAVGQTQHSDFMTPLGQIAFWPFVPFVSAGVPLGQAFVYGQGLMALILSVPLIWAATTRLPPVLGYVSVAVLAAFLTALTHGQEGTMTAISMHYNRWAWVLSFSLVLLAILPSRRWWLYEVDGVLIALGVIVLAFLKITYFVAFAPCLLFILILRAEWRILLVALVTGAVAGGALAFLAWPGIMAYLSDLQTVREANVREYPGLALQTLVVSPAYFVGVLTAIGGAMFLRNAGYKNEGLGLLILVPACLYVSWQNFGNDPVWLILVAIILSTLRPQRRANKPVTKDPSAMIAAAAFAAWVLAVPLIQNHGISAFRHLALNTSTYVPLVPGRETMRDVFMPSLPAHLVRGRTNLTDPELAYGSLSDRDGLPEPFFFAGEHVPSCQLMTGLKGAIETIWADLSPGDHPVFVADLVTVHWLFGDGPPPKGGAPWNYGTLEGLEEGMRLLVPICAVDMRARNIILERFEENGGVATLRRRNSRFLLYAVDGAP